jgi:ABC-2 type transport system ATP-binding protein
MGEQAADITISAQGLSRNFGALAAVKDVSFELRRGEVLGLLGPNGAGKTTTMRMLTGNLAPSAGALRICGIDLFEQPRAAKAHIGYLPEIPPLYRELTVDEYLRLAAKLHRMPKARIAAAVESAKQRCGLAATGKQLIATLSRGYQQRVGIAQAIVHGPDVVILDEPTVGLDPHQIREIRALIRELGGTHSVILSTHILPEVESVCDRVQIMHQGRLVYSDAIAALKHAHGASAIELGLRRPPPVAELAAVAGVSAVSPLSPTLFRVEHAADHDPSARLAELAVQHDWGLFQLAPAHTTLEEVFVKLTLDEPEA